MIKSIQLKLSKIKYSGDSIGDDIRVEGEILNQFFRVDKTIKVNTSIAVNKDIAHFDTEQELFEANIAATLIERDMLFNDVGSTAGRISVDTRTTNPKQFIYNIQIKETRSILGKIWGSKIANFKVTLVAVVTDAVQYIPNDDGGKGWLKVRIEDNKDIESLPAYLKVRPQSSDGKREYFVPIEGVYSNRVVSAKLKDDGSSNLVSDVEHAPVASATYSISKKTFTINGKTYATVDYKDMPWEKGLYDIEIPDYPHALGARYEKDAPRSKTWFRIGHDGDKYLHAGGQSLGCMTVVEIKRWSEIYNTLIKARKGDGVSVGTLEVTD